MLALAKSEQLMVDMVLVWQEEILSVMHTVHIHAHYA